MLVVYQAQYVLDVELGIAKLDLCTVVKSDGRVKVGAPGRLLAHDDVFAAASCNTLQCN